MVKWSGSPSKVEVSPGGRREVRGLKLTRWTYCWEGGILIVVGRFSFIFDRAASWGLFRQVSPHFFALKIGPALIFYNRR